MSPRRFAAAVGRLLRLPVVVTVVAKVSVDVLEDDTVTSTSSRVVDEATILLAVAEVDVLPLCVTVTTSRVTVSKVNRDGRGKVTTSDSTMTLSFVAVGTVRT